MIDDQPYDRMNPDWFKLLERLEEYSAIDYGTSAYSLSTAEARLLLDLISEENGVFWNDVGVGISE